MTLVVGTSIRQIDPKRLQAQLQPILEIGYRGQEYVERYLTAIGVTSLEEVTLSTIYDYREYVRVDAELKESQKRIYRSYLEQAVLGYLSDGCVIKEYVDAQPGQVACKNKVLLFLLLEHIEDPKDIDYELRCRYEAYVEETVAAHKRYEYIKLLDCIKLGAIRQSQTSFRKPQLLFEQKRIFLLYHPDIQIAESFYYVQDKKDLVFDFGMEAPIQLKKQTFSLLEWILENCHHIVIRRKKYLIPLKAFYEVCAKRKVADINLLEKADVEAFMEHIHGRVGTLDDTYMQIVSTFRRFLFLEATETNWNANVWFMERFNLGEERLNPARPIESMSFDLIMNRENRELFKEYMKYQIGISQRLALLTVRRIYYVIRNFLLFCDEMGIAIRNLSGEDLLQYIDRQNEKDILPETFNRSIITLSAWVQYLQVKGVVANFTFYESYYLKHAYLLHHDRSLTAEQELSVIQALGQAPEQLRYMMLNLWSIGLRVSEVCTIKADYYEWDGEDAWIRVYQNKMRMEKRIPITKTLYYEMQDYICRHGLQSGEYVFQNRKGGAYDAGTFSKQMKRFLCEQGLDKDYCFRSHDFRHTMGTKLHKSGTSIQTIRDYLGHKDENMTKQYIDFVQDEIIAANENYLEGSCLLQEET